MATKIRLARHGKRKTIYIVTADSRAKRDGRYIERIGSYNPNTNPATIDIDFDRAMYWVELERNQPPLGLCYLTKEYYTKTIY